MCLDISMKRAIVLLSLFLLACESPAQVSVLDLPTEETVEDSTENRLIVVGEGGTSSQLFMLAARTYQREQGGEIVEVHDGDDFVSKLNEFVAQHGPIDHLEYFGHGNNVALFVNQEPGVNGALYANDPSYNENYRAASIYDLSPSIFDEGATVQMNGCNLAKDHENSGTFAQDFSNHFQVSMVAAQGPTQFSTQPDAIVETDDWAATDLDASSSIYMLPSYLAEGFVHLSPAALSASGYNDVYRGELSTEAIDWLSQKGVDFGDSFKPYAIATGSDVLKVCEALGWTCDIEGSEERQKLLVVLAVMMDAAGQDPGWSSPWYDAYVKAAQREAYLMEGFTNRRYMTRAELAYLSFQLSK